MNTEALTNISSLVIEHATRQGISLRAQFGTRERFQSFVIALTIQGVMDVGGLVFGDHLLVTFQDRTELEAQNELLHKLAYIDGLTGIANRRQFDQVLAAEWRRCRRSHSRISSQSWNC